VADESELREIMRRDGSAAAEIDLDAVLRRTRARRRPRLIAAAAVGALALTGVIIPIGLGTLGTPAPVALSSTAGGEDDGTEDAAAAPEVAPTDSLPRCGGPVADPEPAANGLVLEVSPVSAEAGAERIPVVVTLRNTGADRVRGTVSEPPILTLSRDRSVVWHSTAREDAETAIDLAPGGTLDFVAEFEGRVCAPEDDTDGFRPDLPAADPGSYRIGATLDFTPEAGSAPVRVTGPTSTVDLR
jgi:hypothetical protein